MSQEKCSQSNQKLFLAKLIFVVMTKISLCILFLIFISFWNESQAEKMDLTKDHHESCGFWASVGECEKNPNYMLNYCAPSCSKKVENIPESFYDIVENDIHGNKMEFSRFAGKVVYLVNVASQCGYTEQNYAEFRSLQKYYPDGLEIVLAPCNDFGSQEPGSAVDIHKFAEKRGFGGIILSKNGVNGPKTRLSFKYLKAKTGKSYINWNFDGKFVVDRRGNAYLANDNLEEQIVELLNDKADL